MARASARKRTKPLCRCPTPTASLNDSRITSTRRSAHGVSGAKTRFWKAAKRCMTASKDLQLPSGWATPQLWLKERCARARTGGSSASGGIWPPPISGGICGRQDAGLASGARELQPGNSCATTAPRGNSCATCGQRPLTEINI